VTITHEDIDRRIIVVENALERGVERFGGLESRLDTIIHSVGQLNETIAPIRDDISTIKEMTGGWKAIGVVGRFIKWVGGIAVAVAAVAVMAKAWAITALKVGL